MPLEEGQKDIILQRLKSLVEKRDWPKTICPSEVARAFSKDELSQLDAEGWRDTMDDVREVVWHLRDGGEVEVLQKGKVLDADVALDNVHGPIRVRAKQK